MGSTEIFQKNVVTTSKLNSFLIPSIFPTTFGCLLPANATEKKLDELQMFYFAISLHYSNVSKRKKQQVMSVNIV